MSINGYTLLEIANQSHNNQLMTIANVLSQTNDIFKDAVWIPANGVTTHLYVKTVSLPTGTWRGINEYVDSEIVETRQEEEGLAILESFSYVDKALLDKYSGPARSQFRSSRDKLHVEGMSYTIASAIFYGNPAVNPKTIKGFATRFNDTSMKNVINNGGSGSACTSIWTIQWGDGKVYFIYPKGSKTAGIEVRDLGLQLFTNSAGKKLLAYVTDFIFNIGIVVEDDRCIQRICNVDTASGTSNGFDYTKLNLALNQMKERGKGAKIYVNKDIFTQIDNDAAAKTNVNYSATDPYGNQLTTFKGYPLRLVDAILSTETAI